MKSEKGFLKTLLEVFILHFIVSTIFMLSTYQRFFIYKNIMQLPMWAQVGILSLASFVIYTVASYILIVSIGYQKHFVKYIDSVVIIFAFIFLITFLGSFFVDYTFKMSSVWLSYGIVNPTFGLLMRGILPENRSLINLVWAVSAFIPSLGILVGSYLRLNKESV